MYSLNTPIDTIAGIGPKLVEKFSEKNIHTFKDLLLFLPLRYSDRSNIVQIKDLQPDTLVSFSAQISKVTNFYKNKRKITSAIAQDSTGKVKLMWFNSKFIAQTIQQDATYMVSGKLNDRGMITQPTLEKIADHDAGVSVLQDTILDKSQTIHTGRLVPLYSSTLDIKQGTLRRILKKALTKYALSNQESVCEIPKEILQEQLSLQETFTQLHFPDSPENIIHARERLALEELLSLIKTSETIKTYWKNLKSAQKIQLQEQKIPQSIPFELTQAQQDCVAEIFTDITKKTPMNRVLIGDVGSGKTVVAGIAAYHTIKQGASVVLVAPTKILAEQHYQTLQELFPDIQIELLTSKTKKNSNTSIEKNTIKQARLFIGTHAVINKIETIKPALVIYDEQHRFGVGQRSESAKASITPHTLTMSATPIPRSLMLTIFAHLKVSSITQLPKGRIPTKTWIIPEEKRAGSYNWIAQQLHGTQPQNPQEESCVNLALIVCPFIDPSSHDAFENVASVKETFEVVKTRFAELSVEYKKTFSVALLHGRMKPEEQAAIITKLYNKEIDILVTTPIVEVGVDLPAASIIVIEASERFGMASLHQLRGRVGRAGQQGYCLLFSNSNSSTAKQRLENFSKETNGLKLAELDLQSRGSGDIFGTQQSGFSTLKFSNWTNLELITKAQQLYQKLPKNWQPLFTSTNTKEIRPLAN